jgi:hypothetical protein
MGIGIRITNLKYCRAKLEILMANSKEYPGTTRSRMDCLRQKLAAKGIVIPNSDTVTAEYMGVNLSINYQEPSQLLKIDIVQKPVFMPESLIWGFIDNAVGECP